MKSIVQFSVMMLITASLLITGCENDRCIRTEDYIAFEPVYKRIDEMRKPASFGPARDLISPGKIFYYKGYLLINERHEGIHVINNSDPANPTKVGFLEVLGCIDMAVHQDILYVDSYLDLVGINILNPTSPAEVNRIQDVFQSFYSYSEELGYLVEYIPTETRRTIDCNNRNWGNIFWREGDMILLSSDAAGGAQFGSSGSVSSTIVTGGSMARFTVASDHLYTIDGGEVKVFDVTQALPVLRNKIVMEWGIETLFPMAGTLFVGSNSGLLIYDISDPASPAYRSTFSHATACDPVVVSGNTAYVTLRDGNQCFGFINQLDVIDVSNLWNPKLIRTYPMNNPHGLSVVGETLYLCEGLFGLKTFDVSDPKKIGDRLLDHARGFGAYDVIVLPPGDHVMVIGNDGLYQFDATDRSDLKSLSVIPIGK